MLVGATGFIGGGLISLRYVDYKSELPLSQVNTIQTDVNGNIYLGLGFYGYILIERHINIVWMILTT